jgi:hypothetical protein
MTLGEVAARALASDGWVRLARAPADRGGLALAALCEMTEADRDWDTHWDQCPYVIVGTIGV